MTQRIVDLLEFVEIDDMDGKFCRSIRPCEQGFKTLGNGVAVLQAVSES